MNSNENEKESCMRSRNWYTAFLVIAAAMMLVVSYAPAHAATLPTDGLPAQATEMKVVNDAILAPQVNAGTLTNSPLKTYTFALAVEEMFGHYYIADQEVYPLKYPASCVLAKDLYVNGQTNSPANRALVDKEDSYFQSVVSTTSASLATKWKCITLNSEGQLLIYYSGILAGNTFRPCADQVVMATGHYQRE